MKVFIAIVFSIILISCSQNRNIENPTIDESISSKSTKFIESSDEPEILKEDETIENELIFQFLLDFGHDEALQASRVITPLPVQRYDRIGSLVIEDWLHDPLFLGKEYITHFIEGHENNITFNVERGDETVFSWIYTKRGETKDYFFKRESGKWYLKKIEYSKLGRNSEYEFDAFYCKFLTDSAYQMEHILFPLDYNTWYDSPDEMFKDTSFTLTRDKWSVMSSDSITSFQFSWEKKKESSNNQMIFLSGVDNGIHAELYFEKRNDKWILVKYSNNST